MDGWSHSKLKTANVAHGGVAYGTSKDSHG